MLRFKDRKSRTRVTIPLVGRQENSCSQQGRLPGLLRVCEVHMSFSRDTFHIADPDIFGVKRKKSGGEGYTGGQKK